MRIIWTPRAADDLEQAFDRISEGSPEAASRVVAKIYRRIMELASMPEIGRKGDLPGTRELVFVPWPYIAVYKLSTDTVHILRVRHSSQDWP